MSRKYRPAQCPRCRYLSPEQNIGGVIIPEDCGGGKGGQYPNHTDFDFELESFRTCRDFEPKETNNEQSK